MVNTPAHLLQPGHNAAIVEQVVAGQLPHALAQCIVVLAHGALEPGACGKWDEAGRAPTPRASPWGEASPALRTSSLVDQPYLRTYMLLSDRDGGQGLDLLLVSRRGARVLKLVEELKDKRTVPGAPRGRGRARS